MDCQPFLRLGDTPREKYNINVNLSAGVPITDLQCGSHKIDVAWDNQTSARISLSNPEEFAGNRDFILDYKLTGTEISSGLMLGTGESENFFLLMVQPPERYTPETIPPREYIFILDVSGSMYGFPLDTSKELIRNLAGSLRETDRFNVILFSDSLIQMSPESVPATAENVQKAFASLIMKKAAAVPNWPPPWKRHSPFLPPPAQRAASSPLPTAISPVKERYSISSAGTSAPPISSPSESEAPSTAI